MAEYIDKELAIEGMWAGLREGTICGPEDTETFLRSLPAADVEPVRHGYVVETGNPVCGPCSECGESVNRKWTYCPNCGAHMDEEA